MLFRSSVRVPALKLLLGALPEKAMGLAQLASPVWHVERGAPTPPLLIYHGDEDPQVPIGQSYQLRDAYLKRGGPVSMEVLVGAAHGDPAFYSPKSIAVAVAFLRRVLGE